MAGLKRLFLLFTLFSDSAHCGVTKLFPYLPHPFSSSAYVSYAAHSANTELDVWNRTIRRSIYHKHWQSSSPLHVSSKSARYTNLIQRTIKKRLMVAVQWKLSESLYGAAEVIWRYWVTQMPHGVKLFLEFWKERHVRSSLAHNKSNRVGVGDQRRKKGFPCK